MSDLTRAIDTLDSAVRQRNPDLVASILDAEFALVSLSPTPSSMTRESWLQRLDDGRPDDYEVLERFIDLDGDTASVLQQVRMRSMGPEAADQPALTDSGIAIVTDIWRLRADGWRIWRRHSTPAVVVRTSVETERAPVEPTRAPGDYSEESTGKATVTEVAAVLAAMADAGQDASKVTMAEMEEYVEAFRALKQEGG
jgi:hypothetical protein